jgi:hypothetical protein
MRRRDILVMPRGMTFISPVDGRLSIDKGNEDLGEDPNVSIGASILFEDKLGRHCRYSATSVRGVGIAIELEEKILAQKEKPEAGIDIRRGEPILRNFGDDMILVITREFLQK